jgi:hypothetical protein
LRVELADRLAEGAVCGGDGGLAALRRRLGQDAGKMFDQVKPEIVLPQVDVLTADQG